MDFRQLEYILKIAEENNITRAAEKLYISQSALNQQLLKLERELGTPLFHRSRTDWRLTEAGRIYVEGARAAMNIKRETYNRIYDVSNAQKGHLTVGLTPGRGLRMFTEIYPELHRRCPNLNVRPIEMRVWLQQQAIVKEELDIGFVTMYPQDQPNIVCVPLAKEELVVIIPSGHPLAGNAAPASEPLVEIDLKQLEYEPFVLMDKTSTLRSVCDSIFEHAGFQPNVLFETNNTGSIVSMVESTLCCGIIPEYYLKNQSSRIAAFSLDYHPIWDIAILYKKGRYLSSGAKEFIRLAKEYWES